MALAMILVLSAIALIVMAGLVYMLTSGTQISGLQRRYATAYEAGVGGRDIMYQVVAERGDPNIPSLTNFLIPATNVGGINCLTNKLLSYTADWNAACSNTLTIDPLTVTTFDVRYDLGNYRVYAKIVDTVLGNSAPDFGLAKGSVATTDTGEIKVPTKPFLYSIEINSENIVNADERAKISVLYAY
ncbi:MAG: hypothetical protein LLF28_05370 [Nitrospiraceae bacterium]|nr:hypothetical protein [Nitrospiraceae bacterium]